MTPPPEPATALWWGTYPTAGLGTPTGQGEGLWRHDASGVTQVLELPAPSFVLAHPSLPVLYAVSETERSALHAIDVSDPAAPRVAATVPTGGAFACHLLMAQGEVAIYISHYGTGDLAVLPLETDGLPTSHEPMQLLRHEGSGPNAARQEGPHAHSAAYAPGGRHVLVADLGTDQLRRYAGVPGGILEEDGIAATLPPGSGPRHMVTDGELIHLVCELDVTLRTLRWDPLSATAEVIGETPITTVGPRSADVDGSHILRVDATPYSEPVLLVGARGADVIAVFDLSPEGWPRYRASLDAGHWPRYFTIDGSVADGARLLVTEERGHAVRSYALSDVVTLLPEHETGAVATLPHERYEVTSPACVARA